MLPNTIDNEIIEILYANILKNFSYSKRKLIKKSVLLSIINGSSNENTKVILNSAEKYDDFQSGSITNLVSAGYIDVVDTINLEKVIVLTTKGIWQRESSFGLSLDDVLANIQEQKLHLSNKNESLTPKEKVIIFSMISMRTFSHSCSMDVSIDSYSDRWLEIINKQKIFLEINGIINKDISIFEKKGYEHLVRSLMRHANDLPKKTKSLFSPLKSYQYYLQISSTNEERAKSELGFLLTAIFPNIQSIEKKEEILQQLLDTAHNDIILVNSNLEFVTFYWDRIIADVLDEIYLGIKL